jgi:glycosyltransferase involved in cell wall biosynthesis
MKLAFLIENGENIAGGFYSIFKIAEYLEKRGHEIHIFCAKFPLFFDKEKKQTLHINTRPSLYGKFKGAGIVERFFIRLYHRFHIKSQIRELQPEILFTYQMMIAIRGERIIKNTSIKHCIFAFSTPLWRNRVLGDNHFETYFHKGLLRKWEKYRTTCITADYVIGISQLSQKENERWLRKKIAGYVYPGIDHREQIKDVNREEQVIYLGRLGGTKRVDMIIEALALLDNPPKLIICGGGKEEGSLRALAKRLKVKCDFKGPVTDDEKWKQIQRSKCMLFPTAFEGFGMPPSEALIMGTPCICSSLPILREVYEDTVTYFDDTKEDLAQKIEEVLHMQQDGSKGRQFILSKLGWDKSAEKIERLLDLNQKKSS